MDCVFCKIIARELPSHKVWENDEFQAILDINPNTEGVTLVIPRKHYGSDVTEMPEDVMAKFFEAARTVVKKIEQGLGVKRVAIVVEGMGVDHAHIKLYPLHGLEKKFKETWAKDKIYFKKYEGYISTQLGHQATPQELEITANKIR